MVISESLEELLVGEPRNLKWVASPGRFHQRWDKPPRNLGYLGLGEAQAESQAKSCLERINAAEKKSPGPGSVPAGFDPWLVVQLRLRVIMVGDQ